MARDFVAGHFFFRNGGNPPAGAAHVRILETGWRHKKKSESEPSEDSMTAPVRNALVVAALFLTFGVAPAPVAACHGAPSF
jgi:hypothetical protein